MVDVVGKEESVIGEALCDEVQHNLCRATSGLLLDIVPTLDTSHASCHIFGAIEVRFATGVPSDRAGYCNNGEYDYSVL